MNKVLMVLLILSLIGCASNPPKPTVKPIEIEKKYTPLAVLHPPLPEGVIWEEFEWKVLTPDILRKMLKDYDEGKLTEKDLVFFGISPEGYEKLSVNMAEIIRYIEGQKSVIMYYKENVPDKVFLPKEHHE